LGSDDTDRSIGTANKLVSSFGMVTWLSYSANVGEVIKSRRRHQNSRSKGNLDELIRRYTYLKTKNPGDYMNRSLMNKAREELVPMLEQMFAKLWEPLEHPKRWMEVVTKLKEILLDNGSTLLSYVVLPVDLVVSPNLAELRRSWTIYYPSQDERVLFLKSLPPQLLPVQSFLEDVGSWSCPSPPSGSMRRGKQNQDGYGYVRGCPS
jgi:hypothetical protein